MIVRPDRDSRTQYRSVIPVEVRGKLTLEIH
jgi:hypothetical protein